MRKVSARGQRGSVMDIVHIGKAKTVYRTENPHEYLMEFRNDVTAFDGKRKSTVPDKGKYNAQISARLFELLDEHGIATHYKGMVGDAKMLVRRFPSSRSRSSPEISPLVRSFAS